MMHLQVKASGRDPTRPTPRHKITTLIDLVLNKSKQWVIKDAQPLLEKWIRRHKSRHINDSHLPKPTQRLSTPFYHLMLFISMKIMCSNWRLSWHYNFHFAWLALLYSLPLTPLPFSPPPLIILFIVICCLSMCPTVRVTIPTSHSSTRTATIIMMKKIYVNTKTRFVIFIIVGNISYYYFAKY